MRYILVANPNSGLRKLKKRKLILKKVKKAFNSNKVHGLKTKSSQEFCSLLQNLELQEEDVVVLLGGDGTFHHGLNEVKGGTIAFLPLGTSNFLKHTFGLGNSVVKNAKRILKSPINQMDVVKIEFNNQSVLCTYASIGVEANTMKVSEKLRDKKVPSAVSYGFAVPVSGTKTKKMSALIEYNGVKKNVSFVSFAVQKRPFILPIGTKINPNAKLDDGLLHITMFENIPNLVKGYVNDKTKKDQETRFWTTKKLKIRFRKKLKLQADGNCVGEADQFTFTVLPKKISVKHILVTKE
ncbi:MAG: lipid kinase YegS [Candidatus Woesearchaeota archaeon]|nr:lipid kinase YegS [Candidatus Woesearchaeota archaeon]